MENGVTTDTVKKQVEDFLDATADGRILNERDRDYYDHKQWTPDEIRKLQSRNQAPIVVNRIRPKVEGLIGLYMMRKTDPRAYARTQKHEDASHAITDALRYVADNCDLDTIKMECAGDFWIEGTCGAFINVKPGADGEVDVDLVRIPWDRCYWQASSRMHDFSDARYKGFMIWLDADQVTEAFPDADIEALLQNPDQEKDDTFEDRPKWQDKKQRRIRLAYHFYISKGVWTFCVFSGDTFLLEPQESPFMDEDGKPCCPLEFASANIDRENNRYGEVRGYIPMQDEINHRRSKFLHSLNARQTFGRKGAVTDVKALKREFAKFDGHLEFKGNEFGKDFGVIPTGDMQKGQFELYIDGKAELDAVGFNAQLAGDRQSGDLSGRAIDRLQQAGTIELNRQTAILSNWEKRIYRQVWARIKQFWTREKTIRVTDDQKAPRYLGLNVQMTAQEWMEEQINDQSLDLETHRRLSATYQFLMSAAQGQDPQVAAVAKAKLEEIVNVKNPVPELDVDIILDQSFDTVNIQQEQFDLLVKLSQNPNFGLDPVEIIRASQLRGKDEMIDRIEKSREQAAQTGQQAKQVQLMDAGAKIRKTNADAASSEQDAVQKKIENTLLVTDPQRITSVAV